MKLPRESLWDRLINRLPANDALRAIKAMNHAKHRLNVDYMVVKEMSELMEHYRIHAQVSINALREWDVRDAVQKMNKVYRLRERGFLEAQARSAVSLWLDARRDYRDLRNLAMNYYTPANDSAKGKR